MVTRCGIWNAHDEIANGQFLWMCVLLFDLFGSSSILYSQPNHLFSDKKILKIPKG